MRATLGNVVLQLVCCTSVVLGQPKPATTPHGPELTMAALLDDQLSGLEKQFVDAADAMPADKYTFAPTNGEFKGVRTFGEQVKHVAFYNYATFAIMLGEKPPPDADADRGPDTVRTKTDILKYVRDSFAAGHRATAAINMQNVIVPIESLSDASHGVTRLQQMMFVVYHASSHYGQMVEYLRMNGIIPPASRPTPQSVHRTGAEHLMCPGP
jgi:uncharacterized damage-inducible protein DinB